VRTIKQRISKPAACNCLSWDMHTTDDTVPHYQGPTDWRWPSVRWCDQHEFFNRQKYIQFSLCENNGIYGSAQCSIGVRTSCNVIGGVTWCLPEPNVCRWVEKNRKSVHCCVILL